MSRGLADLRFARQRVTPTIWRLCSAAHSRHMRSAEPVQRFSKKDAALNATYRFRCASTFVSCQAAKAA